MLFITLISIKLIGMLGAQDFDAEMGVADSEEKEELVRSAVVIRNWVEEQRKAGISYDIMKYSYYAETDTAYKIYAHSFGRGRLQECNMQ